MRRQLPSEGETVVTPQGEGRVIALHVISEEVVVQLDPGTVITLPAGSLQRNTDTAAKPETRRNRPTRRRKRP